MALKDGQDFTWQGRESQGERTANREAGKHRTYRRKEEQRAVWVLVGTGGTAEKLTGQTA